MSVSLSHTSFQQIASLVTGLNNSKTSQGVIAEIQSLLNSLGPEGEKYLLMCLLEELDFKTLKVHNDGKDQTKIEFLIQRLKDCVKQKSLLDYFPQVILKVCKTHKYAEYLDEMMNVLKIEPPLRIILPLSLALSENFTVSREGIFLLKAKLGEYCQSNKPVTFPDLHLCSLFHLLKTHSEFAGFTTEMQYLIDTNSGAKKALESKPIHASYVAAMNKATIARSKLCEAFASAGPSATWSMQNIKSILDESPKVDEDSVFQVLLMIANSPSPDGTEYPPIYSEIKTNDWSALLSQKALEDKAKYWHLDNFIRCCINQYSNLKWPNVIKALDRPDLQFASQRAFQALFIIFRKIKQFANFTFPSSVLFETWDNSTSQIIFLLNLFNCESPDIVFFNECPKRLVSLDMYPTLKITSLNPPALQFWTSLDFLEILLELSESDYYVEIRSLFEIPVKLCPHLLLFGLAQLKPKKGAPLLSDLYNQLFPLFLMNHTNSLEIIEAIWKINPSIMIAAISELYKKDSSSLNLSRVLDITQEIKDSLIPIASCKDYNFAVSLGILAAKRDFLHLDQWLAERIKAVGNPFVTAILKYIEDKIITPCKMSHESQHDMILDRSQLTHETLSLVFQLLMNPNHESKLSQSNKTLLTEIYQECCRFFPGIVAESTRSEIEEAANAIFCKLYKEEISIPEVIELMRNYKQSHSNKDKEIFACMITNLFDEYRFFSTYPERELMITAQVYGCVLANRLIEGVTQNIALKCIFETLKKTGKLFDFGVRALEFCKNRMHEWPQHTSMLFQMEQLKQKHIFLLEEIRKSCEEKGVQLDIPPDYNRLLAKAMRENPNMGSRMNLSSSTYSQPNEPKSGNQGNLMNQMQGQFYNQGSGGFGNQIPVQFTNPNVYNPNMKGNIPIDPQGGYYNVSEPILNANALSRLPNTGNMRGAGSDGNSPDSTERASRQTQHQRQQSTNTATTTQSEAVTNKSISEALAQIEKEFPVVSEETLKAITFALNNCTPNNVDDKVSIMRSYIADVNVAIWLAKYIVFKRVPQQPNLHTVFINLASKLNKKEIIPTMTKDTYTYIKLVLGCELSDGDKNILRSLGSWLGLITLARNKPILILDLDVRKLLLDSVENSKLEYIVLLVCKILSPSSQSQVFTYDNAWIRGTLSLLNEIYELPTIKGMLRAELDVLFKELGIERKALPRTQYIFQKKKSIVTEIPEYVTIDPKFLTNHPDLDLKNVVAEAIERAIGEIIPQIMSRSVAIALITAKELVLKDFALEPSEAKFLKGASLIVQNLAGNLALATCREPFRQNLVNCLKENLSAANIDAETKEELINTLSNDNLNLGCSLIKRAVVDKAVEEVKQDSAIYEAIERRRQAAQRGKIYYDEQIWRIVATLPELIRPTPGGLTPEQMRIYEDFANPQKIQPMQSATTLNDSNKKSPTHKPSDAETASRGDRTLDRKSQQILAQFESCIQVLDRLLTNWNNNDRAAIKEFHAARAGIQEILQKREIMETLAFELAIIVMNQIFVPKISPEKMAVFFEALMATKPYFNEKMTTEIVNWILDPREKRIFKYEILLILIRKGFIPLSDFDTIYAEILEKANLLKFFMPISIIIRKLVFDEKVSPDYFKKSIEQLMKNKAQLQETPEMGKFFEELEKQLARAPSTEGSNQKSPTQPQKSSAGGRESSVTNALALLFNEKEADFYKLCASKLYQWLPISETEEEIAEYFNSIADFLQVQSENSLKFFVYITDVCVEHTLSSTKNAENYSSSMGIDTEELNFTYIDALSKLIIVILKSFNNNKSELFEKSLQGVLIVMAKYHEFESEKFNQRPFFKLFSNLLYDIARKEYDLADRTLYLSIFMTTLDRLQPLKYPGFAFAWLQLVSSRYLMPLALENKENKTEMWGKFSLLLIDLFKFFKEIPESELVKSEALKTLYLGTMRLLLVILSDFPEYFIEMSPILCESLSDKTMQIRNLILSAYPPNCTPPHPHHFQPQSIQNKPEFNTIPPLPNGIFDIIKTSNIYPDIVKFLQNPKNDQALHDICSKLIKNDNTKIVINYPIINPFVLFLFRVIDANKNEGKSESFVLLWKILSSFSSNEMREALFNAILNNIRYPNPITFYFIESIFFLFQIQNQDALQEQAILMLQARTSCESPHPWGITYVLFELQRNPKFNLKNRPFYKKLEASGALNRGRNGAPSQEGEF